MRFTLQVVIESDLYPPPRPLELLPQRCERRDTGDRRWLQTGRLQTARPPGAHPTKTPSRPGMCVSVPQVQGPLRASDVAIAQ